MSAMKTLYMEIQIMLEQNAHPVRIAAILHVPVSMVYDVIESMESDTTSEFDPYITVNS